jgi:hypothetical protein
MHLTSRLSTGGSRRHLDFPQRFQGQPEQRKQDCRGVLAHAARQVTDESARAFVMADLAGYLPDDLKTEALAALDKKHPGPLDGNVLDGTNVSLRRACSTVENCSTWGRGMSTKTGLIYRTAGDIFMDWLDGG